MTYAPYVAKYHILIDEKIQKGVALFDFNNNSKDDIVFGTDDDNIYLMYDDGTIAPGFPVNGDGKFRTEPLIVDYNNEPVFIKQGQHFATTFHPELTEDITIHEIFIESFVV